MSRPDQDSPQDLAAAYALGALSPEETRQFEAYLKGSPEARQEVAEYREVAALLALGGPDAAPSPDLRQRVLSQMHGPLVHSVPPSTVPTSIRPPRPAWGALAAGLIAAVGLGFGYVQLRDAERARNQLNRAQQRLAETSELLSQRDRTIAQILAPGTRMYQLTATGDPDPGIQLVWDQRRHRAMVSGHRLKPLPAGRAYQLWFIKDGAPVPSVTFRPGPDGNIRVEDISVPPDGKVSAAAVTVEPTAGSAQPTSPIVMHGPLQDS
jgi:anti-sigma-K factor RskA